VAIFTILKAHRVNFFSLAVVGAIFFAAQLMHLNLNDRVTWAVLLIVTVVSSFLALAFNYWRFLKISEAPISSIAAAAQGYIELHGAASTQKLLKTHFS